MFITSFYSYKGGVGRTVCLLNVAWELAARGKRVVLLDLDLEAPGLHEATLVNENNNFRSPPAGAGILQYFTAWQNAIERNQNKVPREFNQKIPLRENLGPDGNIALLAAGIDDPQSNYEDILSSFSWNKFYQKPYYGRSIFSGLLRRLAQEGFEHLLIDSRTGLTDVEFVSTVHLPDLVVLVSNLSTQSISGTRRVLDQIEEVNKECRNGGSPHRRKGAETSEIRSIIVGSPVPQGELKKRAERISEVQKPSALGRPLDHIVEHLPILAFDERAQILAQQLDPQVVGHGRNFGPAPVFAEIADDILRRSKVAAENLIGAGTLMLRVGYWRDASAFFDAASDLERDHQREYSLVGFDAALNRARAEAVGQIDPTAIEESLISLSKRLHAQHKPEQHLALAEGWLTLSWSQVLRDDYGGAAKAAVRAAEKCEHVLTEYSLRLDSSLLADAELLRAYAWFVAGYNWLERPLWSRATEKLEKALKYYTAMPGFVLQTAMSRVSLSLSVLHQLNIEKARNELNNAEQELKGILRSVRNDRPNLRSGNPSFAQEIGDRLWARWSQSDAEVALAEGDLSHALASLNRAKKTYKKKDSVGEVTVKSRGRLIRAMYRGQYQGENSLEGVAKSLSDLASDADNILLRGIRHECAKTLLFVGVRFLCQDTSRESRLACLDSLRGVYEALAPSHKDPQRRRKDYASEDQFLCILEGLLGEGDRRIVKFEARRIDKTFDIRLWHYIVEALDAIVRGDKEMALDRVSCGYGDAMSKQGPFRIWEGVLDIMARALRGEQGRAECADATVRRAAHILLLPKLLAEAPHDMGMAREIGFAIIGEIGTLEDD